MFNKIQKQLLLKYPLLWNTKFVPMVFIGALINLLYFFIGYVDGGINFKERYDSDLDFTFFSFCFLISVVLIILWLVNYFRNNSLKSFYPKSKYSLFYEWIQILIIVLLLIGFFFPFEIGRKLHKQSYITEDVAKKRCDIISKADFFIDGSFGEAEVDSINSVFKDTVINGEPKYVNIVYKDYITILGRKYGATSLINRNVRGFSFFTDVEDSLRKVEVQKILFKDKKDEVKKIMSDYMSIVKEHELLTNFTKEKWFDITYNAPDFKKYELITPYKPSDSTDSYYYNDYVEPAYATTAVADYEAKKEYSKYFIEQNTLAHNYQEIAKAYVNSIFTQDTLLPFFYFGFGISLLIFSFRVTSGKSWLIAVVALGVLNLILGIFSALSGEFITYTILMILFIAIAIIYYSSILISKKNQKISKIVLNLLLWLFGALIPLVYATYQEMYRKSIEYVNDYYYDPHYEFLRDNFPTMLTVNLVMVFIVMFFLCSSIRKWKGIAEE